MFLACQSSIQSPDTRLIYMACLMLAPLLDARRPAHSSQVMPSMAFVAPSALITLHASEMLQLARLKARLTAPVLVIQGFSCQEASFCWQGRCSAGVSLHGRRRRRLPVDQSAAMASSPVTRSGKVPSPIWVPTPVWPRVKPTGGERFGFDMRTDSFVVLQRSRGML